MLDMAPKINKLETNLICIWQTYMNLYTKFDGCNSYHSGGLCVHADKQTVRGTDRHIDMAHSTGACNPEQEYITYT